MNGDPGDVLQGCRWERLGQIAIGPDFPGLDGGFQHRITGHENDWQMLALVLDNAQQL
ncbi:MAG: hypothetical protein ABIS92_05390 [Polyangia bacterium]